MARHRSYRVQPVIEDQLIGARIRELRKGASLPQADLAKRLGITTRTLGRYERGERPFPANLVSPLAEAVGVTPHDCAASIWPHPST